MAYARLPPLIGKMAILAATTHTPDTPCRSFMPINIECQYMFYLIDIRIEISRNAIPRGLVSSFALRVGANRHNKIMRKNLTEGESVPSVEMGRRDLIKIGAGAVVTTLAGQGALARDAESGQAKPSEAAATRVFSGPGYRNDAGRISGN